MMRNVTMTNPASDAAASISGLQSNDNVNLRNYVDQTIPYPKDAPASDKAVVNFGNVANIERHISGKYTATLVNISKHPRLGNEPIAYTSAIKRIEFNDDGDIVEVETRNTMYRKA